MSRVANVRRADAHRRAQRVRDGVMAVNELLETLDEIHEQQDWMALGYKSWPDYYEGEFGSLKLNAEQRARVVAVMAAAGVSKRRIAKALGISDSTVRLDAKGARNRALPSAEPQVTDSGGVGGEDADISGQAAADAGREISAAADDGEDPAFRSDDPSAGDGSGRSGSVPGNPLDAPAASASPSDQSALVAQQSGSDSPVAPGGAPEEHGAARPFVAHSAGDEAAEEATPPPPVKGFTDEEALTTAVQPVLSPPHLVEDGDLEVEEESDAGPLGSSSTDPAADFMQVWRGFIGEIVGADRDAIGPMLTDDEYGELEDDYTNLGELLAKMRQGS